MAYSASLSIASSTSSTEGVCGKLDTCGAGRLYDVPAGVLGSVYSPFSWVSLIIKCHYQQSSLPYVQRPHLIRSSGTYE